MKNPSQAPIFYDYKGNRYLKVRKITGVFLITVLAWPIGVGIGMRGGGLPPLPARGFALYHKIPLEKDKNLDLREKAVYLAKIDKPDLGTHTG